MKIKRVCKLCEKEFLIYPSRIKRGRSKFCSIDCFKDSRAKEKRICQQCGKEFKAFLSRINAGGGKFCSYKCMGMWRSENFKGENSSHWKGGKTKRICKQCGKEFEIKPSDIKQGGGNFCSNKCHGKRQSENRRGENHPSWQGGISFLPYCSKFNNEFKEYIRDKFGRICFLCSKPESEEGRRLSVHHVNYDKSCMCNDNLTCQFVPLCRSCNSKVNTNREENEQKIKAKMQNKLNGWYV